MNPTSYTIAPGDTLSGIAQKFGIADYNAIARANNITNPNLIIAGHTLTIPGQAPAAAAPKTAAPTAAPVQAPVQAQPQQAQASGSIPLNQLPADLLYNGQLDVSNAVKQAKYNQLNQSYQQNGGALSVAPTNGSAPAPFDLVGATNSAYNTPEIAAANQAITDVNTKITTRQQAQADEQANINDNPFYSEATRVGRSAKLDAKANADIGVLQNQSVMAANRLATLKSDAAIKVNAAMGQYNINQQSYKDTLNQFNTILQAGGLTNATPQDLANYAASTGMSMSVLLSIQKQEQEKQIKTQLITSTDNAGNVTITAVDSKTGEIVSQSKAGSIGQADKQVAVKTPAITKATQQNTIAQIYDTFKKIAGPEGYVSKEDWAKMKSAALSTGDASALTSAEFNREFASFTNPNGAKNGYIYQ